MNSASDEIEIIQVFKYFRNICLTAAVKYLLDPKYFAIGEKLSLGGR